MSVRRLAMSLGSSLATSARYAVFSGGGMKGIAFVGALEALRDLEGIDWGAGIPHRPLGVAGTSIGSLMCLFLALGYTVAEIREWSLNANPSTMCAPNPALIFGDVMALDDGSRMRLQISEIIREKTGVPDMTLSELYRRTGVELVATACDITNNSILYMSHRNMPLTGVVSAVYASMAVPVLFKPLRLSDGRVLVDGGIKDNFPISVFPAEQTLGFNLHSGTVKKIDGISSLLSRVLVCFASPPNSIPVSARIMTLDSTDVSTVDLSMSLNEKEKIRSKNYATAADYLWAWSQKDAGV
jgi:NTE family protein